MDITIGVNHDEVPMVMNKRTGDIKEVRTRSKNMNNDKIKFNLIKNFTRMNTKAWNLLETQLNAKELAVAYKLAKMAEAFSNELSPLSSKTSVSMVADHLGENRRTIMKYIDKLFDLGVLGEFKVSNRREKNHKVWVFNPYLSFNGNVIDKGMKKLFQDTYYANV